MPKKKSESMAKKEPAKRIKPDHWYIMVDLPQADRALVRATAGALDISMTELGRRAIAEFVAKHQKS